MYVYRARLLFSLFFLLPAFALVVHAQDPVPCNFECARVPQDSDVYVEVHAPSLEAPSPNPSAARSLKVLVWNLYKQRNDSFEREFNDYSSRADYLLLQELRLGAQMRTDTLLKSTLWWELATSFFMDNGDRTGVLNASINPPQSANWFRSNDSEPFVKSPKMILANEYALSDGQKLLLVNIHGLNFSGSDAFFNQLEATSSLLAAHPGPILFAGDFNVRDPARLRKLKKFMGRFGLERVEFENQHYTYSLLGQRRVLDQAFMRGLHVDKARVLDESVGSDHKPLWLELSLLE